MYTGRYYHKLDDKHRFSLPVEFRKNLGKRCVITKGLDGCLFVFDADIWSQTLQAATTLGYTKRNNRDFIRLLANAAEQIEIDIHGRVLLSNYLKDLAKLDKDIVIVGSIDRVEIWDQTTYHEYLQRIEAQAEEIAENVNYESK